MEEEKKSRKIGIVVGLIVVIFLMWLGYKIELIDNYDLIEIVLILLVSTIIILWGVAKKKLGIKEKEKTELQLLIQEKEILIEEHYKKLIELDKKIEKENKLDISKWVSVFMNLGLIVFFFSLVYFGSLDGTYLNREIYEAQLNNSMELGKAGLENSVGIIIYSFQILVMKFYDLGSREPVIMFWTFWILIFWWIGYVYVYRILLEGSHKAIKEIFMP